MGLRWVLGLGTLARGPRAVSRGALATAAQPAWLVEVGEVSPRIEGELTEQRGAASRLASVGVAVGVRVRVGVRVTVTVTVRVRVRVRHDVGLGLTLGMTLG